MFRIRAPAITYLLSVIFIVILACIAAVIIADDISADKDADMQGNTVIRLIPVPRVLYEAAVPIEGASDYDAQLVNINMTLLPDSMINEFIADGWTVCVTGADIDNDDNTDTFVYGRTFYDDKRIVVENTEVGMQCGSVLHEFGHYIDYKYGFSCTDEFARIYESDEYDVLRTDMIWTPSTDEPSEFFAEGFADYYCCTDSLEQTCPHLYAYMSDTLSTFS